MKSSSACATRAPDPTLDANSKQRTYPDFVAKLKDGRLFVIEYKGGDRFTADQEKEKALAGEPGPSASGGKGLYPMAQMIDDKSHDVRSQLLAKIGKDS